MTPSIPGADGSRTEDGVGREDMIDIKEDKACAAQIRGVFEQKAFP